MTILAVGSVAYDSIETPYGAFKEIIGGSASHFSISASFFTDLNLVGVVGDDFKQEYIDLFNERDINTSGLEVIKGGKTFHWKGKYEGDLNQAITLETQLNVFETFDPKIPVEFMDNNILFLGNIIPSLQAATIRKASDIKFRALDTMNLWIETARDDLVKAIGMVDILFINDNEARMLSGESLIANCAQKILEMGCRYVVIKRGEYGAGLFGAEECFMIPAYPIKSIKDPTGAGDSFAGGFLGYLDSCGDPDNFFHLKRAMVCGTVMGSFNVEDFSMFRMINLEQEEVQARISEFESIIHY